MGIIWEKLVEFAMTAGIKLLLAIVLLIVGYKLIRLLLHLLTKMDKFTKIDPGAQTFIRSFFAIGLKIMLLMTVAAVLGIPMTSVVALLASAGLAIGLALQGALSNLAGGLMLLIFKPFKVGDVIDTHTDMGTVLEINVFYTILKTFDNRHITLPNGALTNSSIINFSVKEQRRVDLTFSTGYDVDLDEVKQTLLQLADEHPLVFKEPEPFARMREHGDSALIFVMRVWCQAPDYWTIYFDLMESAKRTFDEKGIAIPYPQLDVHLNHLE